ncbi:MAG: iron-sulfur cluster assembly accessory protein [Pseudomonadota bacterium]
MSISLTDSAMTRVRDHIARRGSGIGLRLGVKKTGCNGFSYVIDYADDVHSEDIVFEQSDIKVVVDNDSLPLLDGTEIDFVKDGLNEVFRFRNPNAAGECGCGESFNVGD